MDSDGGDSGFSPQGLRDYHKDTKMRKEGGWRAGIIYLPQ